MVEEKKESPTLSTEGQTTTEGDELSPEDLAKEKEVLLGELDKLGIKSPERLHGMATASHEAGNLGNLLGTANARIVDLEQKLTTALATGPSATSEQEFFAGSSENSVDLGGLMDNRIKTVMPGVIRSVVGELNQEASQAQNAQFEEYAKIQGDENYPIVGAIFEKHISNPNVQMLLRSGRATVKDEYVRTLLAHYKNIALRARDVIKGVKDKTQVGTKAPHMETGQTQVTPTPTGDEEKQEEGKKIMDNWEGTDADLDKLFKHMLPDTDPFLS